MATQILHLIVTPNGISGEFGRAMVRVLARRSRFHILTARANEPDISPRRTKKVFTAPTLGHIRSVFDIAERQYSRHGF